MHRKVLSTREVTCCEHTYAFTLNSEQFRYQSICVFDAYPPTISPIAQTPFRSDHWPECVLDRNQSVRCILIFFGDLFLKASTENDIVMF